MLLEIRLVILYFLAQRGLSRCCLLVFSDEFVDKIVQVVRTVNGGEFVILKAY